MIIEKISIDIDREEVMRLLGRIDSEAGEIDARVVRAVDRGIEEAGRLCEPKGIYVVARGKDLPGVGIFDDLERMAFCVCTIGSRLEDKVTSLTTEGRLLDAVILDSAGSAAAEATARYMDELIAEEASKTGLKTSCRASPGYGDWDIREQKGLFSLVDGGKIGVSLSESCMMKPRKSVSFAKHIDKKPHRLRSENSCRNCDIDICPYRISDIQPE
ncbi:MAG: hypothetical protein KAV42_08940 [Candidatus Krumholzibacteria bacterium]|nr:hypothetical protein [Candidatus Krumholzibacteria bacterium]